MCVQQRGDGRQGSSEELTAQGDKPPWDDGGHPVPRRSSDTARVQSLWNCGRPSLGKHGGAHIPTSLPLQIPSLLKVG